MNHQKLKAKYLFKSYNSFHNYFKNKPIPINRFQKFDSTSSFINLFKNNLSCELNNSQKMPLKKSKTKLKNLTNRNYARNIENDNITKKNDTVNRSYNRRQNTTQNLRNNGRNNINYFIYKRSALLFNEHPNNKNNKTTKNKIPSNPKKTSKNFVSSSIRTGFNFLDHSNKNISKNLKSISIKSNNKKSKIPSIKNSIIKNKKINLSQSCANIKNKMKTIKFNNSLDSLKTNCSRKTDKQKINKILIKNFLATPINTNLKMKPNISANRVLPFKYKLPQKKIKTNILLLTASPKRHSKAKIFIKSKSKKEIVSNDDFFLESNREFVTKNNGINSIKINEFNVNKPNDENLKYTLFKNESEKSSTRPSKIVIGNIEGYKDIIESDKLNNQINNKNGNDEMMFFNEKVKPNKIWNQEKYISLKDVIEYNNIKNTNKKKNTILMSYRDFSHGAVNKKKAIKKVDLYKKDKDYIDSLTTINNNETVDDYKVGKKCRIF